MLIVDNIDRWLGLLRGTTVKRAGIGGIRGN